MHKLFTGSVAAIAMIGSVLSAVPASAQWRDQDRGWHGDRGHHRGWGRDRDRDGRPDRFDRHDDRRWRYYGGNYGYNGYNGRWRTGQRYPYWRDRGYYINDYRAYGLPAPRQGYRYYRADNGDVVMAAVASGVIGLIIGGALAR